MHIQLLALVLTVLPTTLTAPTPSPNPALLESKLTAVASDLFKLKPRSGGDGMHPGADASGVYPIYHFGGTARGKRDKIEDITQRSTGDKKIVAPKKASSKGASTGKSYNDHFWGPRKEKRDRIEDYVHRVAGNKETLTRKIATLEKPSTGNFHRIGAGKEKRSSVKKRGPEPRKIKHKCSDEKKDGVFLPGSCKQETIHHGASPIEMHHHY